MMALIVSICVFVGVVAVVVALAQMFSSESDDKLDDRLNLITGRGKNGKREQSLLETSPLSASFDETTNAFEALVARLGKLGRLFEQADTQLKPAQFFALTGGLAALGWAVPVVMGWHWGSGPALAICLGLLPLLYLIFKRRARLKKFQAQLGDALELISRALRAGHSLGAGFNLVQDEMDPPISREFGRVFEESNLGVPIEEALEDLTERVPNLDLRFFATAVILQRQTGGDLAEILDKISRLIRERFQIWGQIQALTGEGRLSGIVLLALPPALFLAVYRLNPDYIMQLFDDPMGTQMLAGALVMQVLGAIVIQKIINIKV